MRADLGRHQHSVARPHPPLWGRLRKCRGAPKPATFPCSEILHQLLTTLQKKTAAYLYAESILEAKVPAAAWAAEQPALRQQFMDGLLDEELLRAIDEQPEDWL